MTPSCVVSRFRVAHFAALACFGGEYALDRQYYSFGGDQATIRGMLPAQACDGRLNGVTAVRYVDKAGVCSLTFTLSPPRLHTLLPPRPRCCLPLLHCTCLSRATQHCHLHTACAHHRTATHATATAAHCTLRRLPPATLPFPLPAFSMPLPAATCHTACLHLRLPLPGKK